MLAGPTTVDVAFAFAPVTGPGGHPIRLRETFFDRGYYEDEFASKEAIAGVGYTLVADEADLENKSPQVLAQEPDFVKFMRSSQGQWLNLSEAPPDAR
jgi:hypothetical protein